MTRRGWVAAAARRLALAVSAGAVLGVAGRAAMRVVAWQSGVNKSFSLGGSLEIVVLGILVGAPAALLYWACRRRFTLPRWTAVGAALLLFGVFAVWPTPSARSALTATPDAPVATAAIFAAAFVVYGLVLDLLARADGER